MKLLTTKQVQEITGFSGYKVLALIAAKKLPAVNTSSGNLKPRWGIRPEDLEAFLTPAPKADSARISPKQKRRATRRIDEGIPDYIGEMLGGAYRRGTP